MLTNVWETEIDGSWIIIDRYTNTYDAAGNLAVSLYEKMEFITTTMTNNSRTTFTYDAKGNMLTELGETWQNGAWQNSYRETYTYDGKNNMTGYLSETWKGGAWENLKKGTHGYNSNNNLLTSIWEDFLNGAWVKSFKISYTYYNTNGSILNELTEQWLNGTWGNYSKRVYSYDSHGNAVKGESFAYTGASTWAPQSNNLAIQYNNADDILNVSGSSVVVTYTGISGVEDIAITARKYDLAQNYPNPFNPSTTISYSLKKEGNVKLTVYDALGKIVAVVVDEFKPAGSYSAKFDARSLPSGIYIYRLEAGEFSAAKKFILMK
ncbi:MAG: T9SS type A sorting domain-containing protein, partial [Acidobacteriota bacterium]